LGGKKFFSEGNVGLPIEGVGAKDPRYNQE